MAVKIAVIGLFLGAIGIAPVDAASKGVRISGQGLIDPGCLAEGVQPESEAEPYVAVNPADPDNIVAVWQQDRYADSSGNRGTGVATSLDGGKTWHTGVVPEVTQCTGGIDERASDPWVSIGPDGVVYTASLFFQRNTNTTIDPDRPTADPAGDPSGIKVSTSTDGGLTWDGPFEVVRGSSIDREAITADPNQPGTAYTTWLQSEFHGNLTAMGGVLPAVSTSVNAVMFSRTDDHGRTWTPARPILLSPFPFEVPNPNVIEVLPDGTLLNVFGQVSYFDTPEASLRACILADGSPCGNLSIRVLRSGDGGLTWSQPTVVAEGGKPVPLLDPEPDPESGERTPIVDAAWSPSSDVAPDGTVYIAWANRTPPDVEDPNRVTELMLARSNDAGRTWSVRTAFRLKTEAFLPTIAVDGRGVVGLIWYDWRNDVLGDAELTTDVWFASSKDGGLSWKERHLAGPFDLRTAPRKAPNGSVLFIGDYMGLAGVDNGFVAAFTQARPEASVGPSDIFATRIP